MLDSAAGIVSKCCMLQMKRLALTERLDLLGQRYANTVSNDSHSLPFPVVVVSSHVYCTECQHCIEL